MLRPMKTFRQQSPFVLGLGLAGVFVFALLAIYLVLMVFLGSSAPEPETGELFAASGESGGGQRFASADAPTTRPPEDTSLSLTVPKLARTERVPVETGGVADTEALKHGALRVEDTGLPWQAGSNTYIAGHRLGFPGTKSHLLFWDLDKLVGGDRIFLEDANGTVYEYAVFHKEIVGPDAIRVTDPVPGKSVVTLQTCTLPDYSERIIVQAELVAGPTGGEA
ncbi:MAG: sortase [Rubrobacteraceae bacterium]